MDSLSYNDQQQVKSIKQFIVPDVSELLLYFVFALLTVLLLNTGVIWQLITAGSSIDQRSVHESFSAQQTFLDTYPVNDYIGRAVTIVYWGFIGCFSYMVIWLLQHFYFHLRDEKSNQGNALVVTKKKGLGSRASLHIFFGATIFGFMTVLMTFIPVARTMRDMARITIYNLSSFSDYRYFIFSLVLGALYFYILSRFWRVTKYAVHLYSAGVDE